MKGNSIGLVLALASAWIAAAAWATELPPARPSPGGIAIVDLGPATLERPDARFGRRQIMVVRDRQRWMAIVGLAPGIIPGEYVIATASGASLHAFQVQPTVQSADARRTVTPNDPIRLTTAELDAYATASTKTWSETNSLPWPLQRPSAGEYRHAHSTAAHTSGQFRSIEITTAAGASISAPGTGTVVRVFAGSPTPQPSAQSVLIDHGHGIVSVVYGLGAVSVSAPQPVQRGEQLGTAGNRSGDTDPWVGWMLLVNGVTVDALIFTGEPNLE
ncbi:MAG: peptidoglycan DD-metalloendopeptidase family protein [Gammaproteobacteria bacterium]|nr:peptidoglycan DD-metalloendopeptidase family protein [Gammaproteobacteria bacterium]